MTTSDTHLDDAASAAPPGERDDLSSSYPHYSSSSSSSSLLFSAFQSQKTEFLSKPDKSSAGRIDPRAVSVCSTINDRAEYYTTSSCAGRSYLYRGDGIKGHHHFAFSSSASAPADPILEEEKEENAAAGRRGNGDGDGDENDDGRGDDRDRVEGGHDGIAGGGDDVADADADDSSPTGHGYFERYRVSHDLIRDAGRYFDLSTLDPCDGDSFDPTGGGDPLHGLEVTKLRAAAVASAAVAAAASASTSGGEDDDGQRGGKTNAPSSSVGGGGAVGRDGDDDGGDGNVVWLRYEPFILHVSCRSLEAARVLLAAARPSFKSAGVTSWRKEEERGEDGERRRRNRRRRNQKKRQYVVAIWGDEGLDMPLCLPSGGGGENNNNAEEAKKEERASLFQGREDWLAALVNERHRRNWAKIDRFAEAVRAMPKEPVDIFDGDVSDDNDMDDDSDCNGGRSAARTPRRFDVIGDVALLHAVPEGTDEERRAVGRAILKKNKAINICAARTQSLSGPDRSPGEAGVIVLAGPDRSPLITTHSEYGIKCVVDVRRTFFSPRMASERLRICSQVARGERVLVAFCGIGMDALQIAGRTECERVTAVEANAAAAECARRGRRMLARNRGLVGGGRGGPEEAAAKLEIVEGDVMEVARGMLLEKEDKDPGGGGGAGLFDRVVAPRPKEGNQDGDRDEGATAPEEEGGADRSGGGGGGGGRAFLRALLPLLKVEGGECHWYDFCADRELPDGCERTKETIRGVCRELRLEVEFLHVAQVGSVAKRQFRVCVDFRLVGRLPSIPPASGPNM